MSAAGVTSKATSTPVRYFFFIVLIFLCEFSSLFQGQITYFFLAYGKKKGAVKKKKGGQRVWVLINDVSDHVQGLFAQFETNIASGTMVAMMSVPREALTVRSS
jgi:hypothetical protein